MLHSFSTIQIVSFEGVMRMSKIPYNFFACNFFTAMANEIIGFTALKVWL